MTGSGNKADDSSARKQDNKETDRSHASDQGESTSGTKAGAIGSLIVGLSILLIIVGILYVQFTADYVPIQGDTSPVDPHPLALMGYILFCIFSLAVGIYYSFFSMKDENEEKNKK
jgi:hypothetical protein